MAEAKINPIVKQVLELGPTLVFFVLYMWIKDDSFAFAGATYSGFIVAALILVPLLLAAIAALWWLTGEISRMQIFTALAVIVFGGLTAWFNDERFFKMKTTIVWGSFALILSAGLVRGVSLLEYVMGKELPMKSEGWMILTRRMTLMFVAMAVANEVIWRTQTTELWVKLETFALPGALVGFMVLQVMLLQRFLIDPEDPET